jgi:uncharacterized protein
LSDKFVRDPREVVKSGQVVRVKVMEVDAARKRISLSLRLTDEPGAKTSGRSGPAPAGGPARPQNRPASSGRPAAVSAPAGSLADALKRAGFGK